MSKQMVTRWELAIYYIFVFLILREWLIPIFSLTNTGYVMLIMAFIILSFLLSLTNIHFAVLWIVKLIYIGWFIVFVYSDGLSIFSMQGIAFLMEDFQYNLSMIFQGDWFYVTDSFRTFLFFILIWMLVYLVHHWITVRMNIFYFLVMTVLFIGLLDTFTEYDGSQAIVKVVIIGLIMSVFLFMKRLFIETGMKIDWKKYLKLIFPVVLIIGVISSVAIFLPKASPQWPDPVPYIKYAMGQGELPRESGEISKVGYDSDDSTLGGSFVGDNTVVFRVASATKQYWRVETKDIYTSKGWESSEQNSSSVFKPGDSILGSLPVGPDEDTKRATVYVENLYDFLIYPYGLKSFQIDDSFNENELDIVMNKTTEKITLQKQNIPVFVNTYTVEYSTPKYLYSELMNTAPENDENQTLAQQLYLQLPDTLPQRVRDLASEIVEGKNTTYEKARAIEQYFRRNGFIYDTTNVPTPEEGTDYVDQFLFETKRGYCDNFSTSMVVLLRSVDIPARWVKGFAGGKLVKQQNGDQVYEITNNDAHSWVEAYIPGVGWVNFEPTIGFSNNRSIEYDLDLTNEEEEVLIEEEEKQPEQTISNRENSSKQQINFFKNIGAFFKDNQWIFVLMLFILVFIGVVIYKRRRKWLPKFYLFYYRHQEIDDESIEHYYLKLLKILELQGIKRQKGQTLSMFAKRVDHDFGNQYMSELTKIYEEYIYGKNTKDINYVKVKEMWENLINRSTS